jgi:hypothetical protein
LDPVTSLWYREYQYRQAFPGITHPQYLDEVTVEERTWMLHIDGIVKKIEADKAEPDG